MFVSQIIAGLVISLVSAPTPEGPVLPAPTPAGTRKVLVEGVAASSQAAPVTALREMGERILGRSFSVLNGKYVSIGEEGIPASLDTRGKRLVGVEQLKTGLFKAVMEVEGPGEPGGVEEKLRERTQRGAGELRAAGSPLLAREEARDAALTQAILDTIAERYPGYSAPWQLTGRVFFLGTIREEMDGENYSILARIKVWLVEP